MLKIILTFHFTPTHIFYIILLSRRFSMGKPKVKFHKQYLRMKKKKSKRLLYHLMKRQQSAANGSCLIVYHNSHKKLSHSHSFSLFCLSSSFPSSLLPSLSLSILPSPQSNYMESLPVKPALIKTAWIYR